MSTNKTTLPTKPSELIRVALRDLRACEDDDGYVVHMCRWHWPTTDNRGRKVCSVCLAGAVMAQTLDVPREQPIFSMAQILGVAREQPIFSLEQCSGRVKDGLRALDYFRRGMISAGLEMLGYDDVDKLSEEYKQFASGAVYDPADPEPFHRQMNSLADYFESHGL